MADAGINTTRRGAALAGDIARVHAQILITDADHHHLLDGLDRSEVTLLDTSTEQWSRRLADAPELTPHRETTPDDTCYLAMPLFHSNAVYAGWSVALGAGAAMAPTAFSASRFLADVRRYGVTYMNYVGKPLAYILATPEQPDDHDNSLRIAFGNEAADRYQAATLRPPDFGDFLAAQSDLSREAWPRYVWITDDLPSTATNKVLKRELVARGTHPGGGVLWKRDGTSFAPQSAPDTRSPHR